MWKVVGFKVRVSKQGSRYCDLYLQREATAPGQGIEVFTGDYAMERFTYEPVIGDWVMISIGVYQGRRFISDIVKVN